MCLFFSLGPLVRPRDGTDTLVAVLHGQTPGCGSDPNEEKHSVYTNIRTHGVLNNFIRRRVDDVIVHGKNFHKQIIVNTFDYYILS